MNELHLRAVRNENFRTIINALFGQYKHNKLQLYFALWQFIRSKFKYVEDQGDEEIKNPVLMFKYPSGDCDDFSLFIKSALAVLGIRSNYILLGKEPGKFSHIAVITSCGIILDGANPLFNVIHKKYIAKKIL